MPVLLDLDDVVEHFNRVKDDMQSAIDSLEEQVNRLRDDSELQIDDLEIGDKEVNTRIDNAATMFKKLMDQIEDLTNQNKRQQAEIDSLKKRVDNLESSK